MSWNMEGKTVVAKYCGATCTGVIESSRVKYGGKVQHTLVLDEPIQLRWRSEKTDRVLVDEDQVIGEYVKDVGQFVSIKRNA